MDNAALKAPYSAWRILSAPDTSTVSLSFGFACRIVIQGSEGPVRSQSSESEGTLKRPFLYRTVRAPIAPDLTAASRCSIPFLPFEDLPRTSTAKHASPRPIDSTFTGERQGSTLDTERNCLKPDRLKLHPSASILIKSLCLNRLIRVLTSPCPKSRICPSLPLPMLPSSPMTRRAFRTCAWLKLAFGPL